MDIEHTPNSVITSLRLTCEAMAYNIMYFLGVLFNKMADQFKFSISGRNTILEPILNSIQSIAKEKY